MGQIKAIRPLLLVVLALVAYGFSASALRGFVSLPTDRFSPWAKVVAFENHKDEYDAIYLGSSRLYRALRPNVVDRIVSTPNQPFRSFNLSMPGMRNYEGDAILDHIIALAPAKLRWIVLEHQGWAITRMDSEERITKREVHWHRPRQVALLLQFLLADETRSFRERARIALTHIRLLAIWQANIGQGPGAWGTAFVPETRAFKKEIQRNYASGGYRSLESEAGGRSPADNSKFLATQDAYKEKLAQRLKELESSDPRDLPNHHPVAMRNQMERITRAGMLPLYLSLPVITSRAVPPEFRENPDAYRLLDLGRVDLYPEFHAVEARFNEGHMSQFGAGLFSERVGVELRKLVASEMHRDRGRKR